MSLGTVSEIMGRLGVATQHSPIAVFPCDRKERLDACFADTVHFKMSLNSDLIGIYYPDTLGRGYICDLKRKLLSVAEVKSELNSHIVNF